MGAISELYYGRIDPLREINVNAEKYSELDARATELYQSLKEQLSEGAASVLDELLDIRHQMDALTAEDYYTKGFRNGASIMRDVLDG